LRESLAYQEIMAEGGVLTRRADILINLEERFSNEVAEQVHSDIEAIEDLKALERLHRVSARCPDLDAFRAALRREKPARRRASRRRS